MQIAITFITDPMNNLCPLCKTSYPSDVNFCTKDGAKLISIPDNSATEPINTELNNPFGNPNIKNPFEKETQHNPFERNSQVGQPYTKASIGNRIAAILIDSLIFIAVSIPAAIVLAFAFFTAFGNNEALTATLFLIGVLLSLLPLAFLLLKDGFRNGQSPGKKSMKLIVIDLETNMPCTKQQSCIRNAIILLLGIVPIIGNLIEPIMIFATDDGRRLGDRAAKTMVIDKPDNYN